MGKLSNTEAEFKRLCHTNFMLNIVNFSRALACTKSSFKLNDEVITT